MKQLSFVIAACVLIIILCGIPFAEAADILLVRNSPTDVQSLEDWLEDEGHSVTSEQRANGVDDGVGAASTFDLVIVARETNSSDYDDGTEPQDWNALAVPMISMAPHLMRDSRWGWMNGGSLPSGNLTGFDSPFVNPSHPIVSGRSTDLLNPAYAYNGAGSSLSPESVVVATINSGTSHGIFVIPPGTPMYDSQSTPAGDVRIGFIRGNEGSWDNITANGEQILANTIDHALNYTLRTATISNSSATDIAGDSATVGGVVTDTGGATPTVTIYYGGNDGGTSTGAWDDSINMGVQAGAFSAGLIGLSPNSTYYFRCFASHSGGDSWADSTASFMTAGAASPPTIDNQPATTIGHELAEVNGEVTDTGGDSPEVIIYYGDNDGGTDPGNWDGLIMAGVQSGTFTRELVNLTHDTTYYFRCFATNSGGTAWAPSTEPFTTLAYRLPVVVNATPTNITGISAVAQGEVTDTGDDPPLITLYYGDNDGGTDANAWDNAVVLPVQASTFSWPLSPLAPLTMYYYRCHAQNAAGEDWAPGSESFTTLDFDGDVFINEFLASNEGTYTNYPNPGQVPGRTDDWIELINVSGSAVDLSGWHLTDKPGNLDKWTFPPGTSIGAGAFLIVYASGDDAPDTNGNFHTDFKLSAGGDYVALVRPNLAVVSEFGPDGADFPDQDPDISYGILPITATAGYFDIPTPGAPNDPGGQARVKDTKFSVDRGVYTNAFDVLITTATVGAEIYYSTNGNPPIDAAGAPTASGNLYAGAVHIGRSTVLRAAAVKSQLRATNIDTHTYLLTDVSGAGPDGTDPGGFNAAILEQTQPAGWPDLDGYHSTYPDDADWDMDQGISKSADQADRLPTGTTRAQALLQGLLDIPTLSIAMDIDDFAGDDNGIYTHAYGSGFAWERVCSAEWIRGDNSVAWQENCGIRVQGGASRSKAPKHSLSLRFRNEYGAGKLREKVFPDSEVEEFNVVQMRAGYNNSWVHSTTGQRDKGSMIRDQWARDTLLDMGNEDAGHGVMVHLYVNGLYMGVHILGERQDAAHYAAYNGGDEDLLDARNGGAFIDGDATAWNAMQAVVTNTNWSEIQQVVDITTYIDYQIMNRYAANNDLKTSGNWRAAGGGPFPPGQPLLMAPWKLYSWDAENILNSATATTEPLDPMGLRSTLETMPDYMMRFADRLQKHFFHGGALTPEKTAGRWMARAGELDRAIIAEAARWGDHFVGVDAGYVYDRNEDWLDHQDWLIGSFFPVRSDNVLDRYRSQGFFPDTDAPVFNVDGTPQLGGEIPGGGVLSITATSGTIYYTPDGSDPRLDGGAINPGALTIASGATVTLATSGPLRARALDGGEWSPIMEASFYLEALAGAGDLEITEIHYHPTPPTLLERQAGAALPVPQVLGENDFEFVEIQNLSGVPVNLDGVVLTGGFSCTLSNYVLAAGARAVAVGNSEAFLIRYPGLSGLIAGTFSGNLSNGGERMTLSAADTTPLAEFIYNDTKAWPGRADGEGSSLELITTGLPYGDSESWRPGSEYHGSPGSAGLGPDARVVINEVLSHTDDPVVDTIELHNTTAAPVDITGWYLSDDNGTDRAFMIPGTTIPAGGYVTFDEYDFNRITGSAVSGYAGALAALPTTVTAPGHGLSDGDMVTIQGYGGIAAYNDTFEVDVMDGSTFAIETPFLDDHSTSGAWIRGRPFAFSGAHGDKLYLLEADVSGKPVRFVDVVDFDGAFNGETLGRWPNGAGTGTLVPMSADTLGGTNDPARVGPVIISEVMYHPVSAPENEVEYVEILNSGLVTEHLANWRLRGGVDIDFTVAHELAPGETLVGVGFDPATNAVATAAFRSRYGIDASVTLVGPWTDGPLGNDTGTVRLQRADSPPVEEPDYYPQVTEDEVIYSNIAPWPLSPDGAGDALHRAGLGLFGNFASSWIAGSPSPGSHSLAPTDYDSYRYLTFGVGSPPNSGRLDDFDLDGAVNIMEYAHGMDPKVPDTHLLPTAAIVGDQVNFTYRKNTHATDLAFEVQGSTTIIFPSWGPVSNDVLVSTEGTIEVRAASVSLAAEPLLYLRLLISYW